MNCQLTVKLFVAVNCGCSTEPKNFQPCGHLNPVLGAIDKVEAELVKLRYFVGMTNDEAAKVLGISPRTAKYY